MNEHYHIVNGRLVPESELKISPRDIGFRRAYGVFDYLLTYHGAQPFHWPDHLDRLYRSAAQISLSIPWPKEQFSEWLFAALAANTWPGEKAITIIVTGGVGCDSITADPEMPGVVIMIDPRPVYPAAYYEQGVKAITVEHKRYLPTAKTLDYIAGIRHLTLHREQGIREVIYFDPQQVYEAITANLFAVIDNRIYTPATNVLPGITRKVLLQLLSINEPAIREDFSLAQLRRASEIFLTSSSKEILPVTRLDHDPVGNGAIGPVTAEAMALFQQYIETCNK